ncbi:MAG TPA: VWA domain-containing protein [Candidatus Methylomirabilis sp.]|nr:VWA domain-containing protein [Candidatus Methylomirabilis sp.]
MTDFNYPVVTLLIIPISLIIIYYIKPKSIKDILRVVLKLIVIFIILLSIASPYTMIEREGITGSKEIIIIADKTESMRPFDPDIADKVYNYLGNRTQVSIDFLSGTSSSIGDSIFNNIKSEGNILLISDGNNNHGKSITEAISFARNINSTIYYLRQEPIKNDMSVSIVGDAVAIIDIPFGFFIDINTLGTIEGDLKIYVDDKVTDTIHVKQRKRIPLEYFFNTPGSHRIRAEISGEHDEISQNNVFYKSVFVIPKPDILLVSKKESPLSKILGLSYSVDISSDFKNPGSYKAVILDDIFTSELSGNDARILSDYVANGGGLVAVGGQNWNTTENKRPLFEQLLPVKPGGATVRSKNAAVLLVIDISGSTGDISGDAAKLRIEKGLANQVIDSLSTDDFIGVIAFNNVPHTIVPLSRYPDNSKVKDTISRLTYGGTTHLSPALSSAFGMIRTFNGGKNVFVISDGAVADSDPSINVAGSMAEGGINIHTIGVGTDTDETFMRKLAAKGSGIYLKRDQSQGIRLLFDEITNSDNMDGYPILMINSNHFITSGVSLNATIYGYNKVFTKQNAQALVMTSTGNPVISAWRFGLGRVISISTDNGNTWAPQLYDRDNSKIISTSVNYAIGNPRKNDEIMAQDGEVGEPLEVRILSGNEPDYVFDGQPLKFEKTGEQQYIATIIPDSPGFHDISGYTVAINAPIEYREIGNNDQMPAIVTAAGGQIYNLSEIERLIPDISKKNTAVIHERVELAPLFLFAALLLYSIEIILRRLLEIFR